jgi:hypothetical protein
VLAFLTKRALYCAEEVASIAQAAGVAEGASRNRICCEPATASIYSTLREKSSGKTRLCAREPRAWWIIVPCTIHSPFFLRQGNLKWMASALLREHLK